MYMLRSIDRNFQGFSIHWPVEGTEMQADCGEALERARCFSIHWPVEGTEIIDAETKSVKNPGFSIHWPVEGTEIRSV